MEANSISIASFILPISIRDWIIKQTVKGGPAYLALRIEPLGNTSFVMTLKLLLCSASPEDKYYIRGILSVKRFSFLHSLIRA